MSINILYQMCGLHVLDIVSFSINLRTKCVFLVMFRPPLPPCTHLYATVLTPPPPLGAYVINGRPLTNTLHYEP